MIKCIYMYIYTYTNMIYDTIRYDVLIIEQISKFIFLFYIFI